jgi:hypothetical protein
MIKERNAVSPRSSPDRLLRPEFINVGLYQFVHAFQAGCTQLSNDIAPQAPHTGKPTVVAVTKLFLAEITMTTKAILEILGSAHGSHSQKSTEYKRS